MKSDSLIKATASLLALSLLATTCFTTVSEAAGSNRGIISENPVTVSALMMQSLNSKTYEVIVAETEGKKAEVASAKTLKTAQVEQNQVTKQNEEAEQKTKDNKTETKANTVAKKVEEKKTVSKYAKTGIAIEDVVNIRKSANTTSTIVGRLYKGGAATIVKEGKNWVYVKSGNVTGYIKKDLLAIGEAAEKIAPKYITRYAVVNTVTLNVREKANTDARIVIQIGQDEVFKIIKEYAEWYLIKIDSETLGFITKEKEYVKIVGKFAHAISMEELLAQQEEEEEEQEVTTNNTSQTTTRNNSNRTNNKTNNRRSQTRKSSSSKRYTSSSNKSSSSSSTSTRGKSVASYALQFVGNPYVYGGSSLTNGTDCSGFTQSVYRSYGRSLPRTSRAQYASAGRIVSMNDLKSGDLLFYSGSGGTVNHVAIYIGNGQVVHASNKRDGIKVSSYNYRTPVRARRIMD